VLGWLMWAILEGHAARRFPMIVDARWTIHRPLADAVAPKIKALERTGEGGAQRKEKHLPLIKPIPPPAASPRRVGSALGHCSFLLPPS
jgi:hypothetical protein